MNLMNTSKNTSPVLPPHVVITLGDEVTKAALKLTGFAFAPSQRSADDPQPPGTIELCVKHDGKLLERVVLDKEAWKALKSDAEFSSISQDVASGASLQSSLKGQLDVFVNQFDHCGTSYEDTWSCACDAECPKCGKDVSPFDSIAMRTLDEGHDGVFRLTQSEEPAVKLKIAAAMRP